LNDFDKDHYRSNEFPPEIEDLMVEMASLSAQLDQLKAKDDDVMSFNYCLDRYNKAVDHLKIRATHYYEKRKTQFGIQHMRLKRLIATCDSLHFHT